MKKTATAATFCLLLAFFASTAAWAQDYASRAEVEALKKQMQELKSLVGDLKNIIKDQSKTIERLRGHQTEIVPGSGDHVVAQSEEHDMNKPEDGHSADLHELLSGLKPNISVTGDFVANLSEDHHLRTYDDRFDLRGVDLTFTGTIDNVARAVFNFAYHDDDVSLEEGFLDVYDLLPLGTDAKLGRFRVNFGLLNTIHPHALPQVDYPLMYREYLGHEGYIDEGVGIGGTFPSLWGTPFTYTLQMLNGNRHHHGHDDDLVLHDHDDADDDRRLKDYDDLVYVARLTNTLPETESVKVCWGLSGLTGRFEDDSDSPRFYYEAGDLTVLWRPLDDPHRRIRWQSELIAAQIEEGSSWERSYGLYSFLDWSFAPRWIAGLRYDYAERPLRSRDHITEYSAYLTHDYTKSNRLRLQFKNTQRNHDKDSNEVFLQWVFTLGRHVHLEDEH